MTNIYEEIEFAMEWVGNLETPPLPTPSAWTDVAWCNYWREQRMRVLKTLERLKWAGCEGLLDEEEAVQRHD